VGVRIVPTAYYSSVLGVPPVPYCIGYACMYLPVLYPQLWGPGPYIYFFDFFLLFLRFSYLYTILYKKASLLKFSTIALVEWCACVRGVLCGLFPASLVGRTVGVEENPKITFLLMEKYRTPLRFTCFTFLSFLFFYFFRARGEHERHTHRYTNRILVRNYILIRTS
jgi:hypothetical protein